MTMHHWFPSKWQVNLFPRKSLTNTQAWITMKKKKKKRQVQPTAPTSDKHFSSRQLSSSASRGVLPFCHTECQRGSRFKTVNNICASAWTWLREISTYLFLLQAADALGPTKVWCRCLDSSWRPADLPTGAFAPSLQMATRWKRADHSRYCYENGFELPGRV